MRSARLLSLVWISSHPTGLSAVRCRLPCLSFVANCLLRVPLSNSLLAFTYPLPVPPRSRVQNPLSGFAPKLTKESSAWRTSYIMLHVVLIKLFSVRIFRNSVVGYICIFNVVQWNWHQKDA